MATEKKNIILATGGTGGHIFPAQSIAQELIARNYNPFIISDKRYEKYHNNMSGLTVYYIQAATIKGCIFEKLKSAFLILYGIWQAIKLIRKIKPVFVIGFGGYPSFPTLYAAKILNIPIVIHEQNSVFGKANKFCAKSAKLIATSFPETTGLSNIEKEKIIFTGNPVRAAIKALHDKPYPSLNNDSTLNVLIVGGSQGAAILSSAIPDAIAKLSEDKRKRLHITQQCRLEEIEQVRQKYEDLGLNYTLAPFFKEVEKELEIAHLFIGRSGASTVAELNVCGRPAILIPYPHAGNHQMHNALAFASNGSGWVVPEGEFTVTQVADLFETFLNYSEILKVAAGKARENYSDSTKKFTDSVLELIKN